MAQDHCYERDLDARTVGSSMVNGESILSERARLSQWYYIATYITIRMRHHALVHSTS